MKLFVWEEVLADYTDGMMFALANDVHEARQLLLKKCSYIPDRDLAKEPQVIEIDNPSAFYVWGGG
jgi:hypothetical protein